ncbi:arabinogalactan endo-1 4-beta-galactosidase [Pseudothermotoga hypogea DSM 11164 = NBRC 106472]|uniref:Arabinogalactan endo-beta-1,4-galactanase n=1 Tax=Pseudothermotoga hypogea DSM 11164 = NBRC 106472 TaxID=1123384 RepID=A0A0X1KRX2_9THEM|nr:glycosyl hydrolase 53 family protein [Pseudothermotoga hypogea]AJC73971.1 arabinogalactan endo-1 4-beta-galactosidase [Pseudothermotoga hypogea DSM 11164 = NBRC 106472]
MKGLWKVGVIVLMLSSLVFASEKPFIFGVDVSMLYEIERLGGRFYDAGVEIDCLQILKGYGVNWVRLRIWNDPTNLGGGNCNHENMTDLAAKAKKYGLKVLVDFHYSDWWADPGKQNKPKAWNDLHGEDLQKALYDYTKFVLEYMKERDVHVDMVQVGNELNNGFLWPDGQISGPNAGGFDGFTALLKAAVKAVRDFDPNVPIVVHLAEGGNNSLFRWFFDELVKRDVDFDIIGVSYYPYWHGTLEELSFNLNDVSQRYRKDVLVVETAYPWTLQDADGHANIFGDESLQWTAGYLATVRGQMSFLRDLIRVLKQVPEARGLGLFYWEGAWIPVKGAGWKTGEGNPWENQTLFDFQGNALETLKIFRNYEELLEEKAELVRVFPVSLESIVGERMELPQKVQALFSDDSLRSVRVVWQVEEEELKQVGEHRIVGKILDYDSTVEAKLLIKEPTNYLSNWSFETGNFEPWIVEGNKQSVKVVRANPPQNAHHGVYAVNYWLDKPFEFEMYQIVRDLPEGTYKLSMWIQGSGGDEVELSISEHGGERASVRIENRGWLQWNHPVLEVRITSRVVKISLRVKGKAGNWGWVDEFQLIRVK